MPTQAKGVRAVCVRQALLLQMQCWLLYRPLKKVLAGKSRLECAQIDLLL